jgi:hypothetical protein
VHHARDRIELCVAVALLITQGPQTLWIDSDSASQQPYSDKRLEASGEDRSTRPSGAQAHAQRQAARVGGGVSTGRWRPGDPTPLSPFLSPRKILGRRFFSGWPLHAYTAAVTSGYRRVVVLMQPSPRKVRTESAGPHEEGQPTLSSCEYSTTGETGETGRHAGSGWSAGRRGAQAAVNCSLSPD